MEWFRYDIARYTNPRAVIIPLVLLVLALIFLGYTTATTGMPVKPGLDFQGGTAVTLITDQDEAGIRAFFTGYPLESVTRDVGSRQYLLKFDAMSTEENERLVQQITGRYPEASINYIDETFGKTLQGQAVLALLFSFIGMAIVVFVAFRTFIPSLAVILCAFADMAVTAALMNIVGITLTLGTTAALLMLIGYSVDSDVLLTMRVLKRRGALEEKLQGAFRTGIIMTTTTIAAVAAMLIVTTLWNVPVIRDISAVLLIGLFVDIYNTWITNAALLRWYVEKKGVSP
ncbi:MAG: protein translocase subunit SecF [Methanomicrobiales archaeon]|nr:protein translocase subunit SecF [Methanomicrobiales archaeon]MDD1660374.1 protein translocase subunit SecF [Methanomicrobiales archaeon]